MLGAGLLDPLPCPTFGRILPDDHGVYITAPSRSDTCRRTTICFFFFFCFLYGARGGEGIVAVAVAAAVLAVSEGERQGGMEEGRE